jgi:Zn-dependent M28 family amino/carboxypeptidase
MPEKAKRPMILLSLLLLATLLFGAAWFSKRYRAQAQAAPPVASATADPAAREARLRRHVQELAGRIGERNLWHLARLEQAATYIESELSAAGCAVRAQEYVVQKQAARNIVAEVAGRDLAEEIVVVGAHYDSVIGSPGANDNASGVAALLELAREFCAAGPRRTLRLVAFVNEEPPFFKTAEMGSLVYARAARAKGEKIVAMVSLETIGYYSDAEGSQEFPFPPLRFFYPTRGNFVAFVGNFASHRLLRRSLAAFRGAGAFPAEGLVAPEWLVGVDWSDQWSFWRSGYPAIMITDTAPFRYQHYHSRADTPDKLDYGALARVTTGLKEMVEVLCDD